jgi:hypothetical protein
VISALGSGVPGVGLSSGDHVCAFHFGPDERDLLLRLYLRAGLGAGDKCMCIVDEADPDDLLDHLRQHVDSRCLDRDQLMLSDSEHAYLRDGTFTKDRMIEYLDAAVAEAADDSRYAYTRIIGEMSWILRHPAWGAELFDYESEINRFSSRYPQVLVCLYDLERFGANMLVDILRTHPKLLLGGMLIDNPNYLTPTQFSAQRARHYG